MNLIRAGALSARRGSSRPWDASPATIGGLMPRFFLDFWQPTGCIPDPEGIVLRNAEEAYLEAFEAAQEMWSDLLKQRLDPLLCYFEVRSSAGKILFVIPLKEALDSCVDWQSPEIKFRDWLPES